MARGIVVDILLAAAVLVTLASAVGVLVMRNVYQKLHYLTPAALVAPLLVGLAILVESGWAVNSSLIWLALLFVSVANPYLSHATIRAARIRDNGEWRAGPDTRGAAGAPDSGLPGRQGPAAGDRP